MHGWMKQVGTAVGVTGVAALVGGLLAASAMTPSRASASMLETYRCTSLYACGSGDQPVCRDGEEGTELYCSTIPEVIITGD